MHVGAFKLEKGVAANAAMTLLTNLDDNTLSGYSPERFDPRELEVSK